jgi:hypothetical protein
MYVDRFLPAPFLAPFLALRSGILTGLFETQRAMNKAKPSNTLFDRMVNQLSSAAHQAAHPGSSSSPSTNTADPSSSAPAASDPSRLDRLMKFSGLSNITASSSAHGSPALGGGGAEGGAEGVTSPEMMFEEGDGELSVETAEKMLEWHAEAVGRTVELSPASDVCVFVSSFPAAFLLSSTRGWADGTW